MGKQKKTVDLKAVVARPEARSAADPAPRTPAPGVGEGARARRMPADVRSRLRLAVLAHEGVRVPVFLRPGASAPEPVEAAPVENRAAGRPDGGPSR